MLRYRLFVLSVALALLAIALVSVAAAESAPQQNPPRWVQVNKSGFGDPKTALVSNLTEFRGQLYASTAPNVMPDRPGVAQLWRMGDGSNWTAVMSNGFGNPDNFGIDHLFEFKGQFYATTINSATGGEIWRSNDGQSWNQVVSGGFGDVTNGEVMRLFEFKDYLFATTVSYTETHGFDLWRSPSGDSDGWKPVVTNGFGNPKNATLGITEQYKGYLYAGVYSFGLGTEIWRTNDGVHWSKVDGGILPNETTWAVSGMKAFNDYLYISTFEAWPEAGTIGDHVFRCQVCDGSDWTKVADNGLGNANTGSISTLTIYRGQLYFVPGNPVTGLEVWRTTDGTRWEQVGFGGLGNKNNQYPYFSHSNIIYKGHLYIGTLNTVDGGEIWMYGD